MRFSRLSTLLVFLIGFVGYSGSAVAQDTTVTPTEEVFGLDLVAEGLTSPVMLTEAPDGSGRRFIVDQTGQIWILSPDGTLLEEPFLNIEDRMVELNPEYDERGLLGLAFHPNYAGNGRFFIYYSAPLREEAPDDYNHTAHLSEFTVSEEDSNKADPNSEQVLLYIDQPQANHNGGTVAFGPDSLLYLSLGDGGGAGDDDLGHSDDWYAANEGGNGQDVADNLLGSILRINVDAGDPYAIPEDNPFAGDVEGRDEIYAYGFRNPYRMSFDMETGDLYVGDAGQALWEEVSIVELGGNYGWNVKEATHCFNTEDPTNPLEECPDTDPEGDPLINPIIEFRNASAEGGGVGLAVIGGYVYRGDPLADELGGRYIFGTLSRGIVEEEYLGGAVFVARPQEDTLWTFRNMRFASDTSDTTAGLGEFLKGFGQDSEGEVYVLTSEELGPTGDTGKVFKIVPAGDVTARAPAAELPTQVRLHQNYPNPFNPSTTISFDIAQPGPITLTIYDIMGREIITLISDEAFTPGSYTIRWNGQNEAGQSVGSGAYIYRLQAGEVTRSRMMMLVK